MTLAPAPRVPSFPEHPGDGFQVKEDLPTGGYAIWTYSAEFNQWTCQIYNNELNGYIYTRQVLTHPTLVTTADGTQTLVETQEQVNNTIAVATEALVKAGGRTTDQVDFLQNSVGKGTWNHVFSGVGIPRDGEFWTNENASDFQGITRITINDTGIGAGNNPGSLEYTRVGDYLTIQERGTNDFGMYVVDRAAVQVIDNQTIREFWLRVFHNRVSGNTVVNASRCQITTSRPVYTVVQDDEPVVSSRGVLWYREDDDVLSISNYGTGMTGTIGPQWTEINGGPKANPDDYLKLSGGTIDGQLKVNGVEIVNGAQVIELDSPGSLFTVLDYPDGNAIFVINGAGSGKYLGKQNVPENIATVGLVSDNYLPLEGGQMKGELAMGGHKVTGMGDPTADAQAANKRYVDTRLKRTGGTQQKMEGILYLGGNKIAGVGEPELSTDAATKGFVESQISEIVFPEGCWWRSVHQGVRPRVCTPIEGSLTAPISKSQVAFLSMTQEMRRR